MLTNRQGPQLVLLKMAEFLTSDAIPDEIDGQEASSTTVSEMAGAQLRSPGASAQRINARIDIGQHPTPEMLSFIPEYEDYEEGYDSDGQVGPFLEAVVGEDMFAYCIL